MSAAGAQDDKVADDRRDNLTDHDRDNLTDAALELEIELVSELVLAATSSDRPLHQDEVDQLLGVVNNKAVLKENLKENDPVVGTDC